MAFVEIRNVSKSFTSTQPVRHVLKEAKVAVSPGIGFGEGGDQHVRFALIENAHRTRQALRGLRQLF